jgi:polyisoprenoid-binding protein YceI
MTNAGVRPFPGLAAGVVIAVWLLAQQPAAGSGQVVMVIDPAASRIEIDVGKAGLFGFAGHAHAVEAPGISGRVSFDLSDWRRSSVSLEVDAASLRVTGKGEPPADVPEVQRVMLSSQVLDVARFPRILFQSRRITVIDQAASPAAVIVEGDLTLHGTMRPMAIRAGITLDAGGRITARGSFSLKQSDFGMVPVAAGGGAVRVKDELDIHFVLSAKPAG